MCSQFTLKTDSKKIEQALGQKILGSESLSLGGETINFGRDAVTILKSGDELEFEKRIFPVSPFPNARLSGFENQSDSGTDEEVEETQIQRIYQKPRWRKAFAEVPLLVPMTGFTEYAYWSDKAGHALNFKLPRNEVFFAAGIALRPFVPKGKEHGFSLLTHTATEQMLQYHQRLIVILDSSVATQYLEDMAPSDRFDFLINNRYTNDLDVEVLRPMAKGWEKRLAVQIGKLEREQAYRAVLATEQIEG